MTTDETLTYRQTEVQQTDCCIVGGGPAGSVLALLLARQGISVMLLEAHKDFERDFRGETLHPVVMEIMDELGLADRLFQFSHTKIHRLTYQTAEGSNTIADFTRLKTKYPYITMLPQKFFLEFLTKEAKHYPNFQLVMGANVRELIEEKGVIHGVRYLGHKGWHEVQARLTVGADGRFSRVRRLAGLKSIKTSPPMDVLWFRLPRRLEDPKGVVFRFGRGLVLGLIDRSDYWQVSYVIPKGNYQQLRSAGLEVLQRTIAELVPELTDRVELLKDWTQVSLLSVESSRLCCWYRPGLLLIGDAAHVMSPVGGVGINYAIQDAVVAANALVAPLKEHRLMTRDLAVVQRQREWPTRLIQSYQTLVQQRLLASTLNSNQLLTFPLFFRLCLRLPVMRNLPAQLMAFGLWPAHVKH